jgi:hypothetical protein
VPADVNAVAVPQDHLGDQVVADADEIRARRVERVREDAGLAGQRPALVRVDAGAAVRVVIEPEEVFDQVVVIAADLGGLRFVLVEPGARLVEPVDGRIRCISASTTMPTLVDPDPSGMNQTQ